jgi:hypothetical protein
MLKTCGQVTTKDILMPPARMAILQLYDYLARRIPLDLTTDTAHMLGCNGTLDHTTSWIAVADQAEHATWHTWLRAMCIDCDCGLLLQLTTMSTENGALEGINMRRCASCNTLLALYQVSRTAAAPDPDLLRWAADVQVPAYVVTLAQAQAPHQAIVHKVYPAGASFALTDRQFYVSVLRQLELRHRCPRP